MESEDFSTRSAFARSESQCCYCLQAISSSESARAVDSSWFTGLYRTINIMLIIKGSLKRTGGPPAWVLSPPWRGLLSMLFPKDSFPFIVTTRDLLVCI